MMPSPNSGSRWRLLAILDSPLGGSFARSSDRGVAGLIRVRSVRPDLGSSRNCRCEARGRKTGGVDNGGADGADRCGG